ncbi:SusC/RagA family TonB-linked outer membrane protein [Sphingobacterium rhinopitheci]|uniref:SusC/RagA family TonB-linked outer membrane protein n=1 Tax=Sphingobacterium rhinopitheci TaxID=2781960 RepID=UPI001F51D0F5|nr:TonB-dependent receptor [Sphingobacterium rhinopitheci]MCI0920498.1 TonB-dependent receptor [Sphingobacterium rhinopitheci]
MRNTLLFSLALGLAVTTEATAGKVATFANLSAATAYSSGRLIQNTVQGTVSDKDGPVADVTVSIVGVPGSVRTDANGNFKITAALGSTLRFSSIGYVAQDIKVSSGTINVTLASEENTLDEVVVVGYGTQKKGNLTGAVSSINVKETMEGRPIADAGRAMQGTTPGLSITIPSGEVGSDPTIKIRGQIGSISGNSNPLILLDNVEIPSINIVNPDDIESITVLKDAAASSIYGSKAAFGVILITSKQGSKIESNTVSYSNNFSFQNPFKKYEMGTVDALRYSLDAAQRIGQSNIGTMIKVDEESYKKAVEWQEKYGNTIGVNDPTLFGRDWYANALGQKFGVRTYDGYEYMIREWAPTQQHNASLSGRTGKTSYNIGLGLLDQAGMLKTNTDKFARYNASVRVSSDINKYLTARAGAIYSRTNKQYPYATNSLTADPWLYLYRWSSALPFGQDGYGRDMRGPQAETANANVASLAKNYMNFNVGATVNIKSNWKVDFDYNLSNQEQIWNKPGTRFSNFADTWSNAVADMDAAGNRLYVDAEGNYVDASAQGAIPAYTFAPFNTAKGANPDHYRKDNENFMRHTINAFTTYNMSLDGGHDFKFMAGLNKVAEQTESSWLQITELLDIYNPQLAFGNGTITGTGAKSWQSQMGFFGRVNYAYQDKYLFEANLRRDGSSKFPTDLQWRWFPSFSAGWVVSQEQFMDWSKSFMNQLKVRGSWGTIGDQSVSNNLYISTMKNTQSTWINSSGARDWYMSTPTAVSANITWQDITTLNLGADARFLNNRLGFVFDWYQRDTRNMIVPAEGVAATYGTAAPRGNYGALRTRGWEFAADFNHRFENGLGINLRANISDAKSVITEYGSTQLVNGYYSGKVFGEIWGYETDRLYQTSDFNYDAAGNYITTTVNGKVMNQLADPNAAYQSFLQNSDTFIFGAGDVKYKDLNGDGEVNNGKQTITDHGDLKVIGNSTPRYEYGFRLGADYKGFDFSAFFQGVGSRQVWGDGALVIPGYNAADGAMAAAISSNYWTPNNTNAFYPAAYNMSVVAGGNSQLNNMHVQSRYLLDMSYLRIKNITLGYTIPKEVLSKVGISNLRVYTALENFFTWDKLNGLPVDPENVPGSTMFNSTANYNSGRTGVGTPTFKSASFGVQLSF